MVTLYTEEYNLAVENQFARNLSLRVGYVGQHNVKQTNPNDAVQNTGTGVTQPDLNLANPAVVGVSRQATALVQPFSHIYLNNAPIFHTTMNSLQVGSHKQAGHGLAFHSRLGICRIPTGLQLQEDLAPIEFRDVTRESQERRKHFEFRHKGFRAAVVRSENTVRIFIQHRSHARSAVVSV